MLGGFMAAIERLPTSYSSLYMAQLIICKVFSVLIQSNYGFCTYTYIVYTFIIHDIYIVQ
jgi:hypothetical protein